MNYVNVVSFENSCEQNIPCIFWVLIENVRMQLDDEVATILSAILEATRIIEKKVKIENSGDQIPCFINLETYDVNVRAF